MAREKNASSLLRHTHRRPRQVDQYINQFLDATCDESRRAILELLVPPDGQDTPEAYELRAGDIARQLGLARSTTSEHLHQLLKMHLVTTRREGTMIYYRLRNYHLVRAFHELLRALENHYTAQGAPMESPTAAGE
jgi:DNA-binding transcriptional ArsR family regulator